MVAPPHPADFLNDILIPATGRSDGEIARLLGLSPQVFYKILTGESPITRPTAELLGKLFKTGTDYWLNMQADYDRHAAPQIVIERDVASVVVRETPRSDIRFPITFSQPAVDSYVIDGDERQERVPPDERLRHAG